MDLDFEAVLYFDAELLALFLQGQVTFFLVNCQKQVFKALEAFTAQ